MIIQNQRSLIAIHNERDREAVIAEQLKDGDVVKSIGAIDKKVDAQVSASAESVMEMSTMIAMQSETIEVQKDTIDKLTAEFGETVVQLTTMVAEQAAEIEALKGAK